MFFEPGTPHDVFKIDPFKALVGPRPIGWISTRDEQGRPNLAPYSFFNAVCSEPPIVVFSSEGLKHTVTNALHSGVFACNIATYDLRDPMNASSAPLEAGEDEFAFAGLTAKPCRLIEAPRVAECQVVLECKTIKGEQLSDMDGNPAPYHMAFGQVVGIDIDESVVTEGRIDPEKLKPIARLGYRDYAVVEQVFRMGRPKGA